MEKIYGLYLAGGQSSRMGAPKWALDHLNGERFLDYATAQLSRVCNEVYVSTATETPDISLPQICDDQSDTMDLGPLGGLLAAHRAHPTVSWLMLACDLPAMRAEELQLLVNEEAEAVAFLNPMDGVAEATATLYRPSALQKLEAQVSSGNRCARKFLDSLDLKALPAPSYYCLQNTNYPSDYVEWKCRAERGYETPELEVAIEYYAKLKQDAGFTTCKVKTQSVTVAGLWEECRFGHQLSLKQPSVKPAVNNAFVPWEYELQAGDIVAFMPPFAGG